MKSVYIILLVLSGAVTACAQASERPRIVDDKKPVIIKTASVRPSDGTIFVATAYSLRGRTASGEYVREGIIAADPKVLPIGTIVHIEGMGEFIVKDTGGAIKGNRIDIWMPSTKSAMKFGKRKVNVKVVSTGKSKTKKKK